MADITQTKATLAALKELAHDVSLVMEDGKVSVGDVTKLPSLLADVKALVEAVKGVKPELEDLSKEELKEVLELVLDLSLDVAKKFGVEV